MADEAFYVQCELEKNNTKQVSWIQQSIAVEGTKYVSLREDDGTWDHDWTVTKVFNVRLPWAVINERGQDYKKTRKASDI